MSEIVLLVRFPLFDDGFSESLIKGITLLAGIEILPVFNFDL